MRSKGAELKSRIYDTKNDRKRNVSRNPSLKELGDALGVNKSTIYRYLIEMNEDSPLEYDGSSIDTKELNRRTMNTACAAIVDVFLAGKLGLKKRMSASRLTFLVKEIFIFSEQKAILWKRPTSLREISLLS